jgi:hypothetical protein
VPEFNHAGGQGQSRSAPDDAGKDAEGLSYFPMQKAKNI